MAAIAMVEEEVATGKVKEIYADFRATHTKSDRQ